MIVRVIERTNGGWTVNIRSVEIADTCPACGGPRGTPYNHTFCEDGEWFSCDRWDNPCGHVDRYVDVLQEAKRLREGRAQVCFFPSMKPVPPKMAQAVEDYLNQIAGGTHDQP